MKKSFVFIALAIIFFAGAASLHAKGAMGVVRAAGQAAIVVDSLRDAQRVVENAEAMERYQGQQRQEAASDNSVRPHSNYFTHQHRARLFEVSKDWNSAIEEYTLMIQAFKDPFYLADTYNRRGAVYEKKGDQEKADADYEAARNITNPDLPPLGSRLSARPVDGQPPAETETPGVVVVERIIPIEEEPSPEAPTSENADFSWSLDDL